MSHATSLTQLTKILLIVGDLIFMKKICIGPSTLEAKVGGSPEVGISRPAWPTWWNLVLKQIKEKKKSSILPSPTSSCSGWKSPSSPPFSLQSQGKSCLSSLLLPLKSSACFLSPAPFFLPAFFVGLFSSVFYPCLCAKSLWTLHKHDYMTLTSGKLPPWLHKLLKIFSLLTRWNLVSTKNTEN